MEAYSFYSTIQVSQLDSDISQAKVLLDNLNTTLQNLQQFKGETGDNGKTVLSGTTNPLSTLGTIDDLYLNTSSWDMFKKTTDTVWTLQGNIKGAVPNAVTYGTRTRFGGGSDDGVNAMQVAGSLYVSSHIQHSSLVKSSIVRTEGSSQPFPTGYETNNSGIFEIMCTNDYGQIGFGKYIVKVQGGVLIKTVINESFANLVQFSIVNNILFVAVGNTGGNATYQITKILV
jgi:hypothetical protein